MAIYSPSFSIVVPIYNVEEYLAQCLDSVIAQTCQNIEVICVNDGSTDSSRTILSQYTERDSRIIVIDKANGGLSSARNVGIENSKAPYVCFVDSDDLVSPLLCETLYAKFKETNADVVTYGANPFPIDKANQWLIDTLSPRDVVYSKFDPALLLDEKSHPYSWRTACKTSLLCNEGIHFNENIKFGEDEVFAFSLYPRSSKTVLMSDKLYEYRVARTGSMMQYIENHIDEKMRLHVQIVSAVLDDWSQQGILYTYQEALLEWITSFVLFDLFWLPKNSFKEVSTELRSVLAHYWSIDGINKMAIPSSVKRAIIRGVLFARVPLQSNRRKLCFDLIQEKYGYRAAINDYRFAHR